MQAAVVNIEGREVGSVELLDSVFNIEPNEHAVYLDVRLILANRRRGTHKTKTRGEVSGSTRKLYRQKGTGNARAGQIRSPLMRHGGTVHGPVPRDYSFKLNRKVKALARRSALSYKTRDNALTVVEDFRVEEYKTKYIKNILEKITPGVKRVLIVTPLNDYKLYKSASNLPGVEVVEARNLNTYAIMKAHRLLVFKTALETIHNILS
ncbi:MAG: 50S ribosomal protein L4 [Bacteroidia bacterium]|nr:50S ribosomal protein L4 [Bacteroidia bacterium]MDW8333112.1 50S ribosomal protein L4 [Bacteroidia bacterium]